MIPGEIILHSDPIEANVGRRTFQLQVANLGDRPIQVGSHCHFFEVNRWLSFDREKSYGSRLNIPAGTAVRFEPGDSKEVELVQLGGIRRMIGVNGLINGDLDNSVVKKAALEAVRDFAKGES